MASKKTERPHDGVATARIEYLRVENYRALRNVELKEMTPLTVLLGPNGSGKSTLFDVFSFLSECFQFGLRHAWDRRGRAKELKTRGEDGSVVIEIKYRERPKTGSVFGNQELAKSVAAGTPPPARVGDAVKEVLGGSSMPTNCGGSGSIEQRQVREQLERAVGREARKHCRFEGSILDCKQ